MEDPRNLYLWWAISTLIFLSVIVFYQSLYGFPADCRLPALVGRLPQCWAELCLCWRAGAAVVLVAAEHSPQQSCSCCCCFPWQPCARPGCCLSTAHGKYCIAHCTPGLCNKTVTAVTEQLSSESSVYYCAVYLLKWKFLISEWLRYSSVGMSTFAAFFQMLTNAAGAEFGVVFWLGVLWVFLLGFFF